MLDGEIVLFDDAGPPGLRRARPAHPPRRVAHRHARRADADALHRLRPARARRRRRCSSCPSASAATGSSSWSRSPVDLTPASEDPAEAQPWLQGAEGVIAKRQDAPYRPGERVGMVKIKRVRTIDAVVRGWRPGKEEGTLGSLILGALRRRRASCARSATRSGFTRQAEARAAGLPRALRDRRALQRRAEPLERRARAGVASVVRPELVVEVTFDHTSNERIRHGDEARCAGATTRTRASARWTSSTSSHL